MTVVFIETTDMYEQGCLSLSITPDWLLVYTKAFMLSA